MVGVNKLLLLTRSPKFKLFSKINKVSSNNNLFETCYPIILIYNNVKYIFLSKQITLTCFFFTFTSHRGISYKNHFSNILYHQKSLFNNYFVFVAIHFQ